MDVFESLKKLGLNYAKLKLVEAGLPILLAKAEELKIEAERKAQNFLIKTILVSIALLFLLVTFAFFFVAIYFAFLGGHSSEMMASIYTAGVGLLVALLLLLISSWK